MSTLDQALSALAQDGEQWAIDAPEAWSQGRTLYGGMTAALSHHAVQRSMPDLPPLRSAQLTFVGPASGRLFIRPELLRRGRAAAIVAADCRNADGCVARTTFSFGAARDSQVRHVRQAAPDVPPPDACAPFTQGDRPAPGFLGRFEFRHAAGSRLFRPDQEPEFALWTRLRDGDAADPTTSLLAMADALPCAAMVAFPRPAMISSLTWAIDFYGPVPAGDGWRLLWASSEGAADGYTLQAMHLYDRDGRVLASGRQLVSIFV